MNLNVDTVVHLAVESSQLLQILQAATISHITGNRWLTFGPDRLHTLAITLKRISELIS